ncbi:hypothetical protein XA68_18302 [Ophiocordyceps unilateralis]|uniref:Uncharacterized protein n=1 Tax=Ophiocordyceps unilateralis TaxID=268505 RepID=A0A2A9P2P5_OPHUN|nr:hypothetical protein XA68_18302 [Ophiocordyceps unilateralis]
MSQVRNLRAMFENAGARSPPDRGRSPVASSSSSLPTGSYGHDGNESPRRLSTIRTNFVPIRKGGCVGLLSDHSEDSNLFRHRMSAEIDMNSTSTSLSKASDVAKPKCSSDPGILTSKATQLTVAAAQPPQMTGSVLKEIDAKSDMFKQDHTYESPQSPDSAITSNIRKRGGARSSISSTSRLKAAGARGDNGSDAIPRTSRPTKHPTAGRSSSTASNTQSTTRIPPTPKPRTRVLKGGAEDQRVRGAFDETKSIAAPMAKTTTVNAPKTRPTVSGKTKRLETLAGLNHSEAEFSTSKIKSPTKPVTVPATLMAQNVSSVMKGKAQGRTFPRESGTFQTSRLPPHFVSRATSTNSTTAPGIKLIKPHSRPKPSVGPRHTKSFELNTSEAKQPGHVNDNFLARMTRPTQASTSKTIDKAISTPPRNRPTRITPGVERQGRIETRTSLGALNSSQKPKDDQTPVKSTPSLLELKSSVWASSVSPNAAHGPGEQLSEIHTFISPRSSETGAERTLDDNDSPRTECGKQKRRFVEDQGSGAQGARTA